MRDLHRQIHPFSRVFVVLVGSLALVMQFEIIQHDLSDDQPGIGDDQEDDQRSKDHRFHGTTDQMLMSKVLIPPFGQARRWSRLFQSWLDAINISFDSNNCSVLSHRRRRGKLMSSTRPIYMDRSVCMVIERRFFLPLALLRLHSNQTKHGTFVSVEGIDDDATRARIGEAARDSSPPRSSDNSIWR